MLIKEVATQIPKNLLTKWFFKKPIVMTPEETIDFILKNKMSLARFGDGEIRAMFGYDLTFQKYDSKLADGLKKIKNTDKCLVALPRIFFSKNFNNIDNAEKKFWKKHLMKYEYFYRKHFKNLNYGDAFLSRFYIRYKDKSNIANYVQNIKRLWENKNIIFIEGENSRLGYGNDLFDNANSIKRILAPSTNAFEKHDEILETVKNVVKKDDLIILALGPTATLLAYELSEYGYWALDLGHIDIEYEWFKMGAKHKCAIKNKHVNECGSLGNDINVIDTEYQNQIIKKLK